MANLTAKEDIFTTAYRDNPSIDNPEGRQPQLEWKMPMGTLNLPRFYDTVLRLSDVVTVDYELPGCPPQADCVWEAIQELVGVTPPRPDGSARVGCSQKTVCDECPREKQQGKIKQFRRHHEFRPEPGWCLLEQGLLCLGPATRGGCGALCITADMRCEGCYGAPAGAPDQGASMIGALSTLLDATTEDRAEELVSQIADPTGTFYRFSMSSSLMKVRRPQGGKR
jgi:F420-non-reducing hydrogenase small subunit